MKSRPSTTILALAILVLGGGTAVLAGGAKCANNDRHANHADVYVVEGDVMKPVRTGGEVPTYPESGKKERLQGSVVARLLIEKDGTVSDAEIVRPLRQDFDAHTLEVVRQWSFEPATLDDEPVRVHYDITVNYRLDGGDGNEGRDET